MFIDSHAHLTDSRLIGEILAVRTSYLGNGVTTVVDVGYDLQSIQSAKDNAERFSEVYFTAGLHPDVAGIVDETAVCELEKVASHKKCLAIGEIGLDYHYLDYFL